MPQFTQALLREPESIQNLVHRMIDRLHPEAVILFGSRARKTQRENSDFDLACKFIEKDESAWTAFLVDLKESPWTLWPVDLVDYSEVSRDYQENIDREGVIFYG